jgi:hypothetical protein
MTEIHSDVVNVNPLSIPVLPGRILPQVDKRAHPIAWFKQKAGSRSIKT